mgnify:CR=1 FL=1
MKNLFTFIVALFMATGVYAQEKQTYKSFTETTVWFPNQTEVQTAINEGWASVGKVTEKNFPSKTGNVDPETDKIKSKYTTSGIALKHGNGDKTLTLYVKDIRYLKAYAVTTSSADTRVIKVTATPTEGDPVEASSSSKPGVSAVVSLILDPAKNYKVLFEGYKSNMIDGADLALQGVRFIPSTSASTSTSVVIGEAGFATLAPSFAVDYSNRGDGLEAYSVSYNSSSKELTYTQIDGVVEADKAVILKGKGNYILEASSETATVTETGLKASDGNKTGADNIYCLANKTSNGVGFYQVKSDVTIPANKAYLEIATPASTLAKYYSIGIGGNTTGIQAIQQNSVKADGIMYSLSGQRVGKDYKGIVICNGKKMIKK